jgi:hypothetical protein
MFVAYFKILYQIFPGETKENQERYVLLEKWQIDLDITNEHYAIHCFS